MKSAAKILEKIPIKKSLLSRNEYEWMKTLENLTPEDRAKLKEFEDYEKANPSAPELISKRRYNSLTSMSKLTAYESELVAHFEAYEKTNQTPKVEPKPTPIIEKKQGTVIDKATLWLGFTQAFCKTQRKNFEKNESSLANLEPIFKYFLKDESFFSCKNLVKEINGRKLTNSFEKGLLIVGHSGNGKTSIMKSFEYLFKTNVDLAYSENWNNTSDWMRLRFKMVMSDELVSEFEGLQNPDSRTNFNKKYSSHVYMIDDAKRERKSSNFGAVEIIKEVIEKRYNSRARTFITCNYHKDYPNDLHEALVEFGDRYGGHIYDRLFEMFNIIEFKGVSFRK